MPIPSRLGFWFTTNTTPPIPVPLTIEWNTAQSGIVGNGGWQVSDGGRRVRFQVEQSTNCGGYNNNTQTGTAIGSINTGNSSYIFDPILSGIGEVESAAYDLMRLVLNNVLIVRAHAPGGGRGCAPGEPVVTDIIVPPPYVLAANTTHTFSLNFTTNDRFYNGSEMFYLCELVFYRQVGGA